MHTQANALMQPLKTETADAAALGRVVVRKKPARTTISATSAVSCDNQPRPGESRARRGFKLSLVLLLLSSLAAEAAPADLLKPLLGRPGIAFDSLADTLGRAATEVDLTVGQLNQNSARTRPIGVPMDPDVGRNVSAMIQSRGFVAEELTVTTSDGYMLTVQRIVNPLVAPKDRRHLYPVIMQHGLMSSSVDWVIGSLNVRPAEWPRKQANKRQHHQDETHDDNNNNSNLRPGPPTPSTTKSIFDTQERPNALGFLLANNGYDVFLANSRGNLYGQRHVNMSSWRPKFWDFTFDEQIKYDLPDTISMVLKLTNSSKVGYLGHSQGTLMMFGLLSDRPEYADIVEPFVALAPVVFLKNTVSPVRHFAPYAPIFAQVNMWFGTSNAAVRYMAPKVCGPKVLRRELCANVFFLTCGFDEKELDDKRIDAYIDHMPSGTSVKNIAHFGQLVNSGHFAKFDLGILANQVRYKQTRPPDYPLENIRSRSIALFVADNDWLASPADVAHLRSSLRVEPFRVVNMTELEPKWNHIDFVLAKRVGELMNPRVLEVFDHFRPKLE